MMGASAWSSFAVMVLASHAYGQPSEPPPAPDTVFDPNAPPNPPPENPPPNPPPNPPSPPLSNPPPYPPPVVVAPQPRPKKTEHHTLCFAGRPFECASVLLLEIGARGTKQRSLASADVGLLIHDGLNAYGATIGVLGIDGGEAKEDASLWYAARYRRYFGEWGFAGDVSVGNADGLAVEVAFGWADVVAVTAGINRYERADGGHDTLAGVGFRVGSVVIGGVFYVTALLLSAAK